jgi:hypothetical protein
VKNSMNLYLTLLLHSIVACFSSSCEDERWAGTYSGSSIREVVNCTEFIGEAPSADKIIITDWDNSGCCQVSFFRDDRPSCILYANGTDYNSAMFIKAENCEGGIAPLGFVLDYKSHMGRIQDKMMLFIIWYDPDNIDCVVKDDWTLASI